MMESQVQNRVFGVALVASVLMKTNQPKGKQSECSEQWSCLQDSKVWQCYRMYAEKEMKLFHLTASAHCSKVEAEQTN